MDWNMSRKGIETIISEIAEPVVIRHFFELVDVEFVKEGANWYLRVYIDKPGGITIEDCQVVSEELSKKIDARDPIKQSYFLEVSSPGLERPLKTEKDFKRNAGETVMVKLYESINGNKEFKGKLKGLEEEIITIIRDDSEVMKFERNKVAQVRKSL
jgi:ribosome maturation factor RimP